MLNPLIHLHVGEHLANIKWYAFTFPAIFVNIGQNRAILEAIQAIFHQSQAPLATKRSLEIRVL